MPFKAIFSFLALLTLAGCSPYSFSGLKTGMAKDRIVSSWGPPAVIARKLETQLGNVLEIYQYESKPLAGEVERYTLYFKDDRLLYWNTADWRGSSLTERIPGKPKNKKK